MRLPAFLFLLFLLLGACGLPETVEDAQTRIARFHGQLAAGDFEGIWQEASPEFRTHTSSGAYERFRDLHRRLGAPLSFTLENWATASSTVRGTHVSMTTRTVFANGRAKEAFTFKRSPDGILRLLRYDIHNLSIGPAAQSPGAGLRRSA